VARVACKNVDGWALVVVSGFEACGYAEVYKHACAARTGWKGLVYHCARRGAGGTEGAGRLQVRGCVGLTEGGIAESVGE
jgi:hypothetical protein